MKWINSQNRYRFIYRKRAYLIPRWLRKDFEIDEGTRAVVYKQDDHIVLKPLTAQHYRRLRGSLKGTKAMEVFMSEREAGTRTLAMATMVLDAHALMVLFNDEPGADEVEQILVKAESGTPKLLMCVVNWAKLLLDCSWGIEGDS